VGAIDQMIPALLAQGVVSQEGDAIVIHGPEIGVDKILGSGRVTNKLHISAEAFSEQAKLKIEARGGKALVI
jgi:large subunit ribosomal protein L15